MTAERMDVKVVEVIACVRVSSDPEFPKKAGLLEYTTGPCPQCSASIWIGKQAGALAKRTGQRLLCIQCCQALADSPACAMVATRRLDPATGKPGPFEPL